MAYAGYDMDFNDEMVFNDWKEDLLRHQVNKFLFFKKLKGGHKDMRGVWLKGEPQFMVEYCYGGEFLPCEQAYILHLDGEKYYCITMLTGGRDGTESN